MLVIDLDSVVMAGSSLPASFWTFFGRSCSLSWWCLCSMFFCWSPIWSMLDVCRLTQSLLFELCVEILLYLYKKLIEWNIRNKIARIFFYFSLMCDNDWNAKSGLNWRFHLLRLYFQMVSLIFWFKNGRDQSSFWFDLKIIQKK